MEYPHMASLGFTFIFATNLCNKWHRNVLFTNNTNVFVFLNVYRTGSTVEHIGIARSRWSAWYARHSGDDNTGATNNWSLLQSHPSLSNKAANTAVIKLAFFYTHTHHVLLHEAGLPTSCTHWQRSSLYRQFSYWMSDGSDKCTKVNLTALVKVRTHLFCICLIIRVRDFLEPRRPKKHTLKPKIQVHTNLQLAGHF